MNKAQLVIKLAMLPLRKPMAAEYVNDGDGNPKISLSFDNPNGPGSSAIEVDISPTEAQLADVSRNLPLHAADRLASLAILLTPSLP